MKVDSLTSIIPFYLIVYKIGTNAARFAETCSVCSTSAGVTSQN